MQMQASLKVLIENISLLENLCSKGEIEAATELFLQINVDLSQAVKSLEEDAGEELQTCLVDVYERFTLILNNLTSQKKVVAEQLSGYMSSKKKLKAYNNT